MFEVFPFPSAKAQKRGRCRLWKRGLLVLQHQRCRRRQVSRLMYVVVVPEVRSSGFSCSRRSWESINVDSSWTNSNGPSLPQSGAWHMAGALRNCPVCSTMFMVPQRLHLKAACKNHGSDRCGSDNYAFNHD